MALNLLEGIDWIVIESITCEDALKAVVYMK
jgi:hypothetical protein